MTSTESADFLIHTIYRHFKYMYLKENCGSLVSFNKTFLVFVLLWLAFLESVLKLSLRLIPLQYAVHRHTTWLFLMELARRRWMARARGELERATKLLNEAGFPFKEVENAVWEQRIHFAAAIARIRIKNRAFSLISLKLKKLLFMCFVYKRSSI